MKNKYIYLLNLFILLLFLCFNKCFADTINVYSADELYDAASSSNVDKIVLMNDIETNDIISFSINDIDRTLDINGNNLFIHHSAYISFYGNNKLFTITDSNGSGSITSNNDIFCIFANFPSTVLLKDIRVDVIKDSQTHNSCAFFYTSNSYKKNMKTIIDNVVTTTFYTPFNDVTDIVIKKMKIYPTKEPYYSNDNFQNIFLAYKYVDKDSFLLCNNQLFTKDAWTRKESDETCIEVIPKSEFDDLLKISYILDNGNQIDKYVPNGYTITKPYFADENNHNIYWYSDKYHMNDFDFDNYSLENNMTIYGVYYGEFDIKAYNNTYDTIQYGGKIKINDEEPCLSDARTFYRDDSFTIRAIPDKYYSFVEWRDSTTKETYSTDESISFDFYDTSRLDLEAVFERNFKQCSVCFNCFGSLPDEYVPEPITVYSGFNCPYPTDLPKTYGHLKLQGIYADELCTQPFDFDNNYVDDDMTLYCKYVKSYDGYTIINDVDIIVFPPTTNDYTNTNFVEGNWQWNKQTGIPKVLIPSENNYFCNSSNWLKGIDEDSYNVPYIGKFEDGGKYYLKILLNAKNGYAFAENVNINLDGADLLLIEDQSDIEKISLVCLLTPTYVEPLLYLKGDLDRNEVIDANDASVALELYKAQNATAQDIQIGDMDNNSLIDANDASLILEYFKTHQ